MSNPIATTDDLATYLGLGTGATQDIDADRATLILQLAHDKCEQIVSPVPDAARGVELDVAGRAYMNPTTEQSQAPGPFGPVTGALIGGLWLTKANIAELRRLATDGGSGAFTIDPTPSDAGPNNYWPQNPLGPEDIGYGQFLTDFDWPPVSP